jgi:tetratricopeptide (TPR) repeat protein
MEVTAERRRPWVEGRCAVPRRRAVGIVALLMVMATFSVSEASVNRMIDAWVGVQQATAAVDPEQFEAELEQLETVADELAVDRVTPFAVALAARANAVDPEMAAALLMGARRLDPVLPSPEFQLGRLAWSNGDYAGAVVHTIRGVVNVFRNAPTRRALLLSLIPWLAVTVGSVAAALMMLQVLRSLRRIGFDSFQLGLRLFGRANAAVFAIVLVLLPLFAGLGPIWLVVYLFGLTWVYVGRAQQWWPPVLLVLLIVAFPVLRVWTWVLSAPSGLTHRVETMLDERQIDFGTLQEFVGLEVDLERSEAYHVVSGELHRMHGDRDSARLQFEKAVVSNPNSLFARVALAALALEEGNVSIAIQRLDEVVNLNQNVALAHFNLATAYDQIRRFQQGDAARDRARDLGGADLSDIAVPGREARIAFPKITDSWVDQVVADAPEDVVPILGGRGGTSSVVSFVADPMVAASLFGLVFGGGALFALRRWHPPGRQCTKCGKLFSHTVGAAESSVYCSQCVSVFLKRDLVSIEQQATKIRQVHRWEFMSTWWRRLVSVIVPGGYHLISDRGGLALVWTFVVWLPLVGALVWVPLFVASIVPEAPVAALRWTMGFTGVALWAASAVSFAGRR